MKKGRRLWPHISIRFVSPIGGARSGWCLGAEGDGLLIVYDGAQDSADAQEDVTFLVVPLGAEDRTGLLQDPQDVLGAGRRIGLVGEDLHHGAAVAAALPRGGRESAIHADETYW
jgi:hypothetical protein